MNFTVLVDKKPVKCTECYFLGNTLVSHEHDETYELIDYCVLTNCIYEEDLVNMCPLVQSITVQIPEYGDDQSD